MVLGAGNGSGYGFRPNYSLFFVWPAEGTVQKDDDRSKFAPLAAASLVLGGAGYFVFRHGKAKEGELKEAKKALQTVARDPAKRDTLVAQNEKLDKQTDAYKFAGVTGLSLALGFALTAVLLTRWPLRKAVGWAFVIPFLVIGYRAVDWLGIEYLAPVSLIAVMLVGWVTLTGPDERAQREIEAFRKFPVRRHAEVPEGSYRQAFVDAKRAPERLLAEVTSLPGDLARVLPMIGEGRPLAYFQLKRDLAYVAFVEADAYNGSSYVTVLMRLDENGPAESSGPAHYRDDSREESGWVQSSIRFRARPLPIVDGKRIANVGMRFKEDRAFSNSYQVEVAPSTKREDVLEFVSPVVRDELLSFPAIWLQVEGTVMALTLFGDYDAGSTDRLVDIADVLFAEYGADGGPSLLEPDGVLGASTPKKKKKKKASTTPAVA